MMILITKYLILLQKANELVELSDDDYQIEKTLKLNKISLKGFVLDSDLCNQLNENNMNDYSIDELKNILINMKVLQILIILIIY